MRQTGSFPLQIHKNSHLYIWEREIERERKERERETLKRKKGISLDGRNKENLKSELEEGTDTDWDTVSGAGAWSFPSYPDLFSSLFNRPVLQLRC
jgi:hypothetical protein